MSEVVSQTCVFLFLSFCLAHTNHDSLLAWHITYSFTTVSPFIVKTLGLTVSFIFRSNIHKLATVGFQSFVIVL
jgi:hypothetical protein